MAVLVTGAPGWLGNGFVKTLVQGVTFNGTFFQPRKVRCLVLRNSKHSFLEKLNVDIFDGDITDPTSIKKAFKGIETVFHLCGLIHPARRIKKLFTVNTDGTNNVLEAAIRAEVKKIVYMSSNSVAGIRFKNEIMTESDPPKPYMAYGKSKLLAEQIVLKAASEKKIEAVVLRSCWFYGPNQSERQTRFFRMIKSGRPFIFGNGENIRSMSYIENTIQGLLLAEKSDISNGQVYWIADRRPYRTIEIYETVASLLGVKRLKPLFLPGITSEICMCSDYLIQMAGFYVPEIHVAGEMNKYIACSIRRAEDELGYDPKIDLEEGIKRSIEWCVENGIDI